MVFHISLITDENFPLPTILEGIMFQTFQSPTHQVKGRDWGTEQCMNNYTCKFQLRIRHWLCTIDS